MIKSKLATIMGVVCAICLNFNLPSILAQGITVPFTNRSSGWQTLTLTSGNPAGNPNPEAQANQVKGITTGTSQPGVTNAVALHLKACTFYQVAICAPSGSTLSGGGTLPIFDWPDQSLNQTAIWMRNKGLDETVNDNADRCQTFAGHQATGIDWIAVTTSSVTVSSGTTVTVKIDALCAY